MYFFLVCIGTKYVFNKPHVNYCILDTNISRWFCLELYFTMSHNCEVDDVNCKRYIAYNENKIWFCIHGCDKEMDRLFVYFLSLLADHFFLQSHPGHFIVHLPVREELIPYIVFWYISIINAAMWHSCRLDIDSWKCLRCCWMCRVGIYTVS